MSRRLAVVLCAAAGAIGLLLWLAPGASRGRVDPPGSADEPAARSTERLPAPEAARGVDPQRAGAAGSPRAIQEPRAAPASSEPSTATLYGYLRPAAGRAKLEQANWMRLVDRRGKQRLASLGPEGEYSFAGLGSGRCWIGSYSVVDGVVRQALEIDAARGDRRLDLQLALEPAIVVEFVEPDGRPFTGHGVFAAATITPPGAWCEEFRGSWNDILGVGSWASRGMGGLKLPGDAQGSVRLHAPLPLYVSALRRQRVLETRRVEPGEERVRFVIDPRSPELQPGIVRLRLIDSATRQPAIGARVLLDTSSHQPLGPQGVDGVFRESVLPGWVGLGIARGHHVPPSVFVRVEPGVEHDLGDVVLEPPVSISGRFRDERGACVAPSVRYQFVGPAAAPFPRGEQIYQASAEPDGSFRIEGLQPGVYLLRMSDPQGGLGLARRTVDARAGSVEGLEWTLPRGTPLLVSGNDDWALVRYVVLDAAGESIVDSRLWGPEPQEILLAPGVYELEVRVEGAPPLPRRPLVIGNEPVELVLP